MNTNIDTLAQNRRELVKVLRKNNAETGFMSTLTNLYPDNTHFIYELLQNAEDTRAQQVRFILHWDRIEFEHDGEKLFSYNDVEAITNIGNSTKRDSSASIGRFGVGFKSVFAYTKTPEVMSGDFHFKIIDMWIPEPERLSSNQSRHKHTRFILPFDNSKKLPEQARHEIEKLLKALNAATLLFLTYIRKIEYLLPDSSLGYIERVNHDHNRVEIRVQHPRELATTSTWFLKFDKEIQIEDEETEEENQKIKMCYIAVAFGLTRGEAKAGAKDELAGGECVAYEWELAPMEPGHVCIYFPADKEVSNLRFHLHAPFAPTPARDSIRDCVGNNKLRDSLANLLAESMPIIRDQGLLTVHALAILPNNKDNIPKFFQVFMTRLLQEFKSHDLVPMKNGGHANAECIFHGLNAFTALIDDDDIFTILGDDYPPPMWAASPSQQNHRENDFFSMLEIEQWDSVKLVSALSQLEKSCLKSWLSSKCSAWHRSFCETLFFLINVTLKYHSYQKQLIINTLTGLPIVRCRDGDFREGSECFFSPVDGDQYSKLPLVANSFYFFGTDEDKGVCEFFELIGLRELDYVEEIIKIILPKYENPNQVVSIEEHQQDMIAITRAYSTDSQEKKSRLKKKLRETPFVLAKTKGAEGTVYRKPCKLYFETQELQSYFSDSNEIDFIRSSYYDNYKHFLKDLDVSDSVRVERTAKNNQGFVVLINSFGWHERGRDDFDPNIAVEGLDFALCSTTMERSRFIWNTIAVPNSSCIRGVVESCPRETFARHEEKELISKFGRLLIDNRWLPSADGSLKKPCELRLNDLPEGFTHNEKLANALGMKRAEKESAVDTLSGGNPLRKRLLEEIASATEDDLKRYEKLKPRQQQAMPVPSFKEGLANFIRPQGREVQADRFNGADQEACSVHNPLRYQGKCDESLISALEEHKKAPQVVRFTLVREKSDNEMAREFLYNEYQGRCQITNLTFEKASFNSGCNFKNYFEACSLLSYTNASYYNDPGNMLCVSADTFAKLKFARFEWLDDMLSIINVFESGGSSARSIDAKIKLAGHESTITWSQRHFIRLISLYKLA